MRIARVRFLEPVTGVHCQQSTVTRLRIHTTPGNNATAVEMAIEMFDMMLRVSYEKDLHGASTDSCSVTGARRWRRA